MRKKAFYLKVRTTDIVEDMTRYIGYRGQPRTLEPYRASNREPWRHYIEIGDYSYFMRPSGSNDFWDRSAHDRYRSFGVWTEVLTELPQ